MVNRKLNFVLILICTELLVLILIGVYWVHTSTQKYRSLESELSQLKQVSQNNQISNKTTNDYIRTIEFMEKETEKHREFIEQQRLYLIWIIAAIGTIGTALTAYLGIKSRDDVNNLIKSQYEVAIKESLNDYIGGQPKHKYLQNCIDKNYAAKNKKILFIMKESDQNINFNKLMNHLDNEGYSVERENKSNKELILDRINTYDIIVHEVSVNEANDSDGFVTKLSKKCNSEKIYCIHFFAGHMSASEARKDYSTIANTIVTILERLNNLLYFAPKEL